MAGGAGRIDALLPAQGLGLEHGVLRHSPVVALHELVGVHVADARRGSAGRGEQDKVKKVNF